MTGEIRPAEGRDLSRIVEIERTSFSTPWNPRAFEALLTHPTTLFRVFDAGNDEGVMAHGILWWVGDEAELANLAVAPEARGRGVGGRLLDALLLEAALRGVRAVFLEVRASNSAALSLYRTRGFRAAGVRPDYYTRPREDARVLRLELDSDASPP